VIIGESDPEGCAACQGPALGYRNGTMYSSYTAASFPRKLELAERHGVNFEGALTWAFEFENQPWFAGFRALASNGVGLPVLNVFRMLARMSGLRLPTASTHCVALDQILAAGIRSTPDVHALASGRPGELQVLVWHYHDDDVSGPNALVQLRIEHAALGSDPRLEHYRVDGEHGNAYAAWQRWGSPAEPSAEQRALLERASELVRLPAEATRVQADSQGVELEFCLPRQGVSLIVLGSAIAQ
jgi:xylan 1,4-beta-xylosidase